MHTADDEREGCWAEGKAGERMCNGMNAETHLDGTDIKKKREVGALMPSSGGSIGE